MEALQYLAAAGVQLLNIQVWLFMILGVFSGIVFGAIPGLTATTAIATRGSRR